MSYNNAYRYNNQSDNQDTEEVRKTEPLRDDMQLQYKYGFAQFEGKQGELLLKRILKTIIPPGAYSTIAAIIDMNLPPHPYIGTQAIATQAAKSVRQVERDLHNLQEMGLLRMYPDQVNMGGYVRTVTRKDFSNLWKFADDYYQWEKSTAFQVYPPDRKYAEVIKSNRHIYARVVRFENYRIILDTARRGPKQKNTELVRWSSRETVKLDDVQSGQLQFNGLEIYAPSSKYNGMSVYESYSLNIDSIEDSNLTQEKNSVEQDSPLTRRDDVAPPLEDTQDLEEDFMGECGKGSEEYSFEIPSSAQRPEKPSRKRNTREVVKETTAQQKGKAYIEAVLEEEDRKAHTPKQERHKKWLESEELRKEHKGIVNLYSHIAERLNDQNPRSTETLLAKMQKEIGMGEEEFIKHIDYARQKVLSIPADKIRKRGIDGKPNRTPLFLQILKDALKRGIAACQEDDRRADEIRNMFKVVEQEKAQKDAELDAREQSIAQAEEDPESWMGPIVEAVEASHRAQQEIVEKDASAQEPEPAQQFASPDDPRRKKMVAAAQQITQVTGVPTHIGGMCQCGCKIKVRVNWTPYCAKCTEIPGWTEEMYTQVDAIIAEMMTEIA